MKTNTQCNARKTSMRQPKNHALTKTAFTPHCVTLQPEARGANRSGWPWGVMAAGIGAGGGTDSACRRRDRRLRSCWRHQQWSVRAYGPPWWSGPERTTLHGDGRPPWRGGCLRLASCSTRRTSAGGGQLRRRSRVCRGRARSTSSLLFLWCTFSVPLCRR